jgi:hypothetical protein
MDYPEKKTVETTTQQIRQAGVFIILPAFPYTTTPLSPSRSKDD